MADTKISNLPAATTPLAGTEVLPIVQSGTTKKVAVSDLTAGRNIAAQDITFTGTASGGAGSFTTLAASSTVSGTGFSTYLASPPAIGGTAAAAVSSTNLAYTGTLTGGTGVVNIGSGQVYKDASGNVGVGTSSPQSKLSVSNSGAAGFEFFTNYPGGGVGTYIQSYNRSSPGYVSTAYDAADHAFSINGTERMRLNSSGNLLVGTTSSVGKVTVESTSNVVPALFLNNSGSSGTANPNISIRKFDNDTTTSNAFIQFAINNGANGSGQINANGVSQAAFGSFSDQRLKENIVDLPSQLENIMALRPVEFDYIESEGGGHQIGFIAQEMQEVYSDAVGERSDGMLTITGWNKTEAILVKAIQELKAEFDAYKKAHP